MNEIGDWKREDARHHDREADRYDALIGREYAPYQATHTARPWARALADASARIVLDVGGGTGRTALPVAEAGATVIVLDTSRGMLRAARAKAVKAGMRRLRYVVGDAERLPLGEAAVDAVVCQGVLHHVRNVAVALSEVDRVLRPGGRLCLAEPDAAGSRLSHAVRLLARGLRPLAAAAGRRSPAAANERPLVASAVVGPLVAWHYTVLQTHLVHPPYVYRYLPPRWSQWAAARLNRSSAGRTSGDLFVIDARKPSVDPLVSPGTLC